MFVELQNVDELASNPPTSLPPHLSGLVTVKVWRGRCPATGRRALGSNCLELCRWDRSPEGPGCAPNNLVVLSADVANQIDKEGTVCLDAAVRAKIETTLAAERPEW